jgi:hypothetical protein
MSYINKINVNNNDYDLMSINSIYDTTERIIGTYFGKPLYRKAFVITPSEYVNLQDDNNRKNYPTNIDIETLLRADMHIKYAQAGYSVNTKTYGMHNVAVSNTYDCGVHSCKNGVLNILIGSAQVSILTDDIHLILEYTKTSDSSD